MPFATSEDRVRIHYEVEGEGPPLVLLHGFSSRLEGWRELGYVDRLHDRYRLVLIDARGHGESDKPTTPEAYDNRVRVLDVAGVLAALEIPRAHLFGYSMGAIIGMSAAIYAPQRFASLVLGGASPYGKRDLVLATVPFDGLWGRLKDLPGADHDAWAACHADSARFGGAVQALKTTRLPILLLAGEQDTKPYQGAKGFAESHGKEFVALPGKDHMGAISDVETVVPRLIAFLDAHPIE